MTKADRIEFDIRLKKCEHYERLAIESCMNYKMLSKRDALAKLRQRQGGI